MNRASTNHFTASSHFRPRRPTKTPNQCGRCWRRHWPAGSGGEPGRGADLDHGQGLHAFADLRSPYGARRCRLFAANAHFDDHPEESRRSGRYHVVSADSVLAFLGRLDPWHRRRVVALD
ncbi:MAG: DUF2145 domain-containing protein [Gammaproteobacteria bacterium]